MTSIEEFYRNKVIFITGGTGFVGKVVIEKLLYSCDKISKIYLLLREKKGESALQRLEKFKQDAVFFRVQKEFPERFKILAPIFGDVSLINLGINDDDLPKLLDVNIVLHCAASVRFDDPLKVALMENTRGTREMIKLALKMPFLESFVHVSTTYCVIENYEIEEKIYPPVFDWEKAIKLAETANEEELNALELKLTNSPNTYVFSKRISESLVASYKDSLPLAIFRPSIIMGAEQEPAPGYVANFNGPVGMFMASSCGVQRSMHLPKGENLSAIVPIDTCSNGIIVAAYVRHKMAKGELPVYNASTKKIGNIEIFRRSKRMVEQFPPKYVMWRPGGWITRYKIEYYIRILLTQILPAILLDFVLIAIKRKPMLMKIQRKLWLTLLALIYFIAHEWDIKNDKFLGMLDEIPENERKIFGFEEKIKKNVDYFRVCYFGGIRFLLNQDEETTKKARKNLQRLILLDKILKYSIFGLIFWCLFNYFSSFF